MSCDVGFLICTNGEMRQVKPKEKEFSAEELHELVGGYIEMLRLGPHLFMFVNEDGLRLELPFNSWASNLCGQSIVGNAVVVPDNLVS